MDEEERGNDKAREHKRPREAARKGPMSQDAENSGQLYHHHKQSPGILAFILNNSNECIIKVRLKERKQQQKHL